MAHTRGKNLPCGRYDFSLCKYNWTILIFINYFLYAHALAWESSEMCRSNLLGDEDSYCVSFDLCPPMNTLVKSKEKTIEEFRLLQRNTCNFDNNDPMICCSIKDIRFDVNEASKENGDKNKPNQLLVFPGQSSPSGGQFPTTTTIRPRTTTKHDSTMTRTTTPQTTHSQDYHLKLSLLPSLNECGFSVVDSGFNDRIIGGNNSGRGAHPWLARLAVYNSKTDVTEFGCSGTIINKKYVLTAAHCKPKQKFLKITTVRVGEYNSDTDEDCEGRSDTFPCSRFTDYDVEKFIIHPDYDPKAKINDIALIKVSQDIVFDKLFVHPTCLPIWKRYGLQRKYSQNNVTQFDGAMGIVAGWGKKLWYQTDETNILQEIKTPIVPNDECLRQFEETKIQLNLTDKHMCVGGVDGKSACQGDSGGAALTPIKTKINGSFKKKYFQLGILGFGTKRCSVFPTIFTRVSAFTDWILNNMDLK